MGWVKTRRGEIVSSRIPHMIIKKKKKKKEKMPGANLDVVVGEIIIKLGYSGNNVRYCKMHEKEPPPATA